MSLASNEQHIKAQARIGPVKDDPDQPAFPCVIGSRWSFGVLQQLHRPFWLAGADKTGGGLICFRLQQPVFCSSKLKTRGLQIWGWLLLTPVAVSVAGNAVGGTFMIQPGGANLHLTPLEQRHWFEIRTAHFNIFSCGDLPEVYRLAGKLEQFCSAYSELAGAESVESPPIIVMAFPDHATMEPYLPLYRGKPGNMAAFFKRGSDENLIVLSLPDARSSAAGMEVIFHEYTHLLFRRNARLWPLWLDEGMAEIYSTLQTSGYAARIASPIPRHLQTLRQGNLMPLKELFSVTHDSPQYNEARRQGMFYAESWLLTHYLMNGNHGQNRARFSRFTALLRQGELPEEAFTNAMQASLPAVENGLRRYLAGEVFLPIDLKLSTDVSRSVALNTHWITPVEVYYRLGDELMRIDKLEMANAFFDQGKKLAPASPLPEEGLGLLANLRKDHAEALNHLQAAIRLGSRNYLTYYLCALEAFKATADHEDNYSRLPDKLAAEICGDLDRSIELMPDFGPSQQLYGVLEMVQGEDLATAGRHLQRAVRLEPENPSYLLSFAQYLLATQHPTAARQMLAPLLRPDMDARFRAEAEKINADISRVYPPNQ